MNIPSKLKDYVKTVWKALRTGGTAWTPERLNNIEDGVEGTTGKINEIIDYLTEFKPQNVMTSQQYEALPDSRKDSQEVFYLSDVGKIICQRISYGGGGEDINLITYEQFKTMEAAGTFIEGGNYRVIDYPDETLLDSESVKYNNTNVKEELNTINGKISSNTFGKRIDVKNCDITNPYIAPSDGYVFGQGDNAILNINDVGMADLTYRNCIYIRKGTKIHFETALPSWAWYHPFV